MEGETASQEIEIPYEPLEWQEDFHTSKARIRVLSCGRRVGKTTAAVNEGLKLALSVKSIGMIVAPTYAQTGILWRALIYDFCPPMLILYINKSERIIELINGSLIYFKSADNPPSMRGYGLDWVVIDEAAYVVAEVWENVIRPALADRKGKAILIGTPAGRNWFYELWAKGQEGNEDIKSWQLPTSANHLIAKDEIENAKSNLPELVFRQEFQAEFLEDIGAVFKNISANITNATQPKPTTPIYAGWDPARLQDFSAFIIIDSNGSVLECKRWQKISWDAQIERITALLNKFSVDKIVMDSSGVGDPAEELLKRKLAEARINTVVEGYKFTQVSKQQLIENLQIKMEQASLKIPAQFTYLINELKIFGYQKQKKGDVFLEAPPGYHDDCVMALALACKHLARPRIAWYAKP